MSNIIIPGKVWTGLVDHNNRPVVSDEIKKRASQERARYAMPIGGNYRYYKIKAGDTWAVGYVYDRPIPRNAIAINPKTAYEMVYGKEEANRGTNKEQWKKVSTNNVGAVNISERIDGDGTDINVAALPNPNNEEVFTKVKETLKQHNI